MQTKLVHFCRLGFPNKFMGACMCVCECARVCDDVKLFPVPSSPSCFVADAIVLCAYVPVR